MTTLETKQLNKSNSSTLLNESPYRPLLIGADAEAVAH